MNNRYICTKLINSPSMEALSVSDYRKKLAASFDRADEGERVIIRRKNSLYALVSLGREELPFLRGNSVRWMNSQTA